MVAALSRRPRARLRAPAVALLLLACGAPTATPREVDAETAHLIPLTPPGSRLALDAPPRLTRVPHTLRYETSDGALRLVISDATVEPGREPALAEAYLARVRREHEGEVRMQPVALRGAEGVELTVNAEDQRLRVITLWRGGRVARLTVRHAPEDARRVERMIDTVRFDPDATVDPFAALELAAPVPEGMRAHEASNEQLLLRAGGRVTPFPSAAAAVDVLYVPFADGERPEDAQARGRLLGSRFAGLAIDAPRIVPVEGGALPGIELSTHTVADGARLALYGAYLEGEGGAWLVRGSVDAAHAETWVPRWRAFTRALRPRDRPEDRRAGR